MASEYRAYMAANQCEQIGLIFISFLVNFSFKSRCAYNSCVDLKCIETSREKIKINTTTSAATAKAPMANVIICRRQQQPASTRVVGGIIKRINRHTEFLRKNRANI